MQRFVVRPALTGLSYGAAAGVAALVGAPLIGDFGALSVLASTVLTALGGSAWGLQRGLLAGVRGALVEDRLLLRAIPAGLMQGDTLTAEQAEKLAQAVRDYVLGPVFLPAWRPVRMLWRAALSSALPMEVLAALPARLEAEVAAARARGSGGIAVRVVVESYLLGLADGGIGRARRLLDGAAVVVLALLFVAPLGVEKAMRKTQTKD
jgi:hypothetical protein